MKRVLAVLLLISALAFGVFSAPNASATHTNSRIVVAAVHSHPVAPHTYQASQRNIGPNAWDRSTVIFQVMKAGTNTEMTWFHERLSYYRTVAGSTLNILEQGCVVNMPCNRVYFDFYGTTSWDGLTTEAYTNCLAANKWCRYDGTNSLVTHTTVQFNRSNGIDSFTYTAMQSLFCHEDGRAIAELEAASGATCMQDATYQYPSLTATEEQSVRDKYVGVAR